jgi:SAM-dependent methyltransferase
MPGLKSAKDILLQHDPKNPSTKDKKKHPKFEFQAYGYRLASDLNDLANLKIYMRLAKNVERGVMERAYAYVIDSGVDEKGKLFLWKLKQLRTEIDKKRKLSNFKYDFVMKELRRVRNDIAKVLLKRAENDFNDYKFILFHEIFQSFEPFKDKKNVKRNALFVGVDSAKVVDMFHIFGYRIFGIDISNKLTKLVKSKLDYASPKPKVIAKDFLKNSYDKNSFDMIVLENFWQFIPIDDELKFLKEVKSKLKEDGKLLIGLKSSMQTNQKWQSFFTNGEEKYIFLKTSTEEDFVSLLKKLKLRIEKRIGDDKVVYYLLTY